MSERRVGAVQRWCNSFGYIFETHSRRYFFHKNQFDSTRLPIVNEMVEFTIPEQPMPAFGKLLVVHDVVPLGRIATSGGNVEPLPESQIGSDAAVKS